MHICVTNCNTAKSTADTAVKDMKREEDIKTTIFATMKRMQEQRENDVAQAQADAKERVQLKQTINDLQDRVHDCVETIKSQQLAQFDLVRQLHILTYIDNSMLTAGVYTKELKQKYEKALLDSNQDLRGHVLKAKQDKAAADKLREEKLQLAICRVCQCNLESQAQSKQQSQEHIKQSHYLNADDSVGHFDNARENVRADQSVELAENPANKASHYYDKKIYLTRIKQLESNLASSAERYAHLEREKQQCSEELAKISSQCQDILAKHQALLELTKQDSVLDENGQPRPTFVRYAEYAEVKQALDKLKANEVLMKEKIQHLQAFKDTHMAAKSTTHGRTHGNVASNSNVIRNNASANVKLSINTNPSATPTDSAVIELQQENAPVGNIDKGTIPNDHNSLDVQVAAGMLEDENANDEADMRDFFGSIADYNSEYGGSTVTSPVSASASSATNKARTMSTSSKMFEFGSAVSPHVGPAANPDSTSTSSTASSSSASQSGTGVTGSNGDGLAVAANAVDDNKL
jgi:hypothetical protein